MKKVNNYIFIIKTIIVLCCAFCFIKNLHKGYKLLELNDIDSIEKLNLTIESSTKEFNRIVEKITIVKIK